jgi:hypothetical protein
LGLEEFDQPEFEMKDKIGCQQNRCRRDGEKYETVLGTRAIHNVETFD